jgi:hypothetical protein
VSAGRNPVAGKRVQVYRSGDLKNDVKAGYARIVNEINEHRFVEPEKITAGGYLDAWEPAHTRDLEAATAAGPRHAGQEANYN